MQGTCTRLVMVADPKLPFSADPQETRLCWRSIWQSDLFLVNINECLHSTTVRSLPSIYCKAHLLCSEKNFEEQVWNSSTLKGESPVTESTAFLLQPKDWMKAFFFFFFFKFISSKGGLLPSPWNQTASVATSSVWTLGKPSSKVFGLEEPPFH